MARFNRVDNNTVFLGALILLVLVVLVFSSYLISQGNRQTSTTQAEEFLTLQSVNLAKNSSYYDKKDVAFFDMTAGDLKGKLYGLKSDNEAEVLGFLSADPKLDLGAGDITSLIPDKPQNLRMVQTIDDRNEAYLLEAGHQIDATHYYFEQTRCGNIPVFGGNVQIHVSDSNVYALSGALIKNDVDCTQSVNENQAQSVALSTFNTEVQSESANVVESKAYVYSTSLLDTSSSEQMNYVTQFVNVCNEAGVCKGYFVDKKTGKVISSIHTSSDALNRRVIAGSKTRTEGGAPSGNAKLDKTYDILGDTYNYFNTTHKLDSYNGGGATIIAEVPTCSNNASWNGANITVCSELVAHDVIAHEFQHAVTQYAVGGQSLIYQNESGALNESLSDIFGFALDTANWTMGETTSLGSIRDFSDPPRRGHPSRMFSTTEKDGARYYCQSGDGGGVHINSGVFNKAFYLMIEGGSFNGCTITGLGKANVDKAHLVVFRALQTYMKGKNTGNYRDMYDAVVQACNDIHQAGSAECSTIVAAMQATEMDQQTIGASRGPQCTGISAKPATCIGGGGNPQPTGSTTPAVTPGPTSQVSPTPVITGVPTSAPAPSKKSPLKSSVSAPQSATGDVELTYDGTIYNLNASISAAAFSSFFATDDSDNIRAGFQAGVPIRGELVGPDKVDTGTFTFENGKYINKYSSGKDLSKHGTYQVVAINDKGDEIPFLLGDLGTSGSDTGGGGGTGSANTVRLDISLRLQGIEKKPKSTEAVLIKVGVGGGELADTQYKSVLFTPGDGGIWKGKAEFDIAEGSEYKVLIKGPKHTQRKICENNPKEAQPGLYKCSINTISLKKGDNVLDFSGVIMLAGDLPVKQDGIVNARDVLAVREKLNKSDFEALAIGDVNYDGVINAVDDALVIFTLANRTDQN